MNANIGYALISRDVRAGETVEVMRRDGPVAARLVDLPFL
jgi:antitoxin (DNA-binding transcriptional repressor) of toxin-antitoxin stability system